MGSQEMWDEFLTQQARTNGDSKLLLYNWHRKKFCPHCKCFIYPHWENVCRHCARRHEILFRKFP